MYNVEKHSAFLENAGCFTRCTVYLEIFTRQAFHDLPAKLNFHIFIFANGDLTIYIVYIAKGLF